MGDGTLIARWRGQVTCACAPNVQCKKIRNSMHPDSTWFREFVLWLVGYRVNLVSPCIGDDIISANGW